MSTKEVSESMTRIYRVLSKFDCLSQTAGIAYRSTKQWDKVRCEIGFEAIRTIAEVKEIVADFKKSKNWVSPFMKDCLYYERQNGLHGQLESMLEGRETISSGNSSVALSCSTPNCIAPPWMVHQNGKCSDCNQKTREL